MAKAKKKPLSWYPGKAINVEQADGLPAGQIMVVYVTYDRKLCVAFPNGGQEIHSVKEIEGFASRHGGWAEELVDKTRRFREYDPFSTDIFEAGSYVKHLRDHGKTDEEIIEGTLARLREHLKEV